MSINFFFNSFTTAQRDLGPSGTNLITYPLTMMQLALLYFHNKVLAIPPNLNFDPDLFRGWVPVI